MSKKDVLDRIAGLSPAKRAILEKKLKSDFKSNPLERGIPRRPQEGSIPLSFGQQRMWFLDQLEPGNSTYNDRYAVRLRGTLNVDVLQQSFNEIVKRHEALRTRFITVDGDPVQEILPALTLDLPTVDFSHLAEEEREAEARRIMTADANLPFQLAAGPMLRLKLLKLVETDHILLLVIHHIVWDGWSLGVLIQELAAFYSALLIGEEAALSPLPIQYGDYAHWQRETLQGDALEAKLAYWREQLKGTLPVIELPTDRARPPLQTYNGNTYKFPLPKHIPQKLEELAKGEGATLYMALLAAFKTLLYRYSGQEDILVGTPVANRNNAETEELIGMFINTVVMRTEVTGDLAFRELLARVRTVALDGYAQQDTPFEKLVEALQPERNRSHSPIFQIFFNLQNAPLAAFKLPGVTLELMDVENDSAKFDMTLFIEQQEDGLLGKLEYNVDLFDGIMIERMADHYQTLLESVLANPDAKVADLSIMSQAEGADNAVLKVINDTAVDYDLSQLLTDAFVKHAEEHPNRIALSCEGKTMTYGELHERSNQVGHFLRAQGVQRNQLVGILMERGLEMMVGLYGIVKSGAAYVPIDPEYPAQRVQYMIANSEAPFVLTKGKYVEQAVEIAGDVTTLNSLLVLDQKKVEANLGRLTAYTQADLEKAPSTTPERINEVTDVAYMIYTSGSTGNPKGAKVSHRAIVNRLLWHQDQFQATPQDVIAQRTSVCFDVSVWELFWGLRHGAKLAIIPTEIVKDPYRMHELLVEEGVTVMHFVPSLFSLFVYALQNIDEEERAIPTLRWIVTSGEALPDNTVQLWFEMFPEGTKIANLYGPTEAAVDVTCYVIDKMPERSILIGKPIANTQIYILDPQGRPCPLLVKGELHIGGVQLAEGYHNNPEKTAESFIANHLMGTPGARLYKTGDLARVLPDGNIEYLGRLDSQVKVRGYRIELGEIDNALQQHPNVEAAAVLAKTAPDGNKTLVAFYTSNNPDLDVPELKAFLGSKMPEYMVPATFVLLDEMPLSPNGKVDRKALAQLKIETGSEKKKSSYEAPTDELQGKIIAIWARLLERDAETIGVGDNFFDIGGHSLLVAKVHDALRRELSIEIPMTDLFQYTTVKALSDAITGKGTTDSGQGAKKTKKKKAKLDTDVAIIGIGLRLPQSDNVYEFWQHLRAGHELITDIDESELEPHPFNTDPRNRANLVPRGAYLDDVDKFDAEFFGMSEREARMLDPQHRIFLECCYASIQNAGYNVDKIDGRVSLYAGGTITQYMQPDMMGTSLGDMYQAYLAGQARFLATRVAYKLNLTGEAITLDTACSTSLVAIHMACESLISGKSDYALAGAASLATPQKTGYVYEPNFIMSPDGHCRAFDKDAAGTVMGNGAGVVFLKRLSDAVRDGDPIYAVVKGSAINNDGSLKIGYTAPSVQGQAEVIELAQEAAGVDPDTISYIEAHGTGTSLGDPIEVAALTQAFRKRTDRKQYCAIGSVKTNLGHLDAAAGIVGVIKTALAMKYGEIPPSLHYNEPNPQIDFENSPFYVNASLSKWNPDGVPRRGGISSFGIGGTNAHVILEEAPKKK